MTASVDFSLSLEDQCRAIWAATEERHERLEAERLEEPEVLLYDGRMRLQFHVQNEDEYEWTDPDNETGRGKLVIDFDTDAGQWLWDLKGRLDRGEKMVCFAVVNHLGRRWSGPIDYPELETDDAGNSVVTAYFDSDYEQLKWRNLWSNPALSAFFQAPRVFMLGGPARWVIGTALHLNLRRAHGPDTPYATDDPLHDEAELDRSGWPIVVKPLSFSEDVAAGTTWALLPARFEDWHDVCAQIIEDAELSVRWRRWFEGDPPPWPGARVRHGALVVWFEDRSGIFEGTANGGSLFDGLTRAVRDFVDDFTENNDQAITGIPDVPAYRVPGDRRTDPRAPYVFYGPESPGILSEKSRWTPARGLRLTTGGHSAPGVNELIDATLQAIGDLTAMIPGVPPLGGAASAILRPLFEDVVLAWMTVWLRRRAEASGDFALYEYFLDNSGKAYTIASLMVIRAGVRATNTQFSTEVELIDSAPYSIGAPGHGHFDKGDRILRSIRGDRSGRVHAERVGEVTLKASRGERPSYGIKLGPPRASEDSFEKVMRQLDKFRSAMQRQGVF